MSLDGSDSARAKRFGSSSRTTARFARVLVDKPNRLSRGGKAKAKTRV